MGQDAGAGVSIRSWLTSGAALVVALFAFLWQWALRQRDNARAATRRERTRADQAEAAQQQGEEAAAAATDGNRETEAARERVRREAEEGRRDHFEEGW